MNTDNTDIDVAAAETASGRSWKLTVRYAVILLAATFAVGVLSGFVQGFATAARVAIPSWVASIQYAAELAVSILVFFSLARRQATPTWRQAWMVYALAQGVAIPVSSLIFGIPVAGLLLSALIGCACVAIGTWIGRRSAHGQRVAAAVG